MSSRLFTCFHYIHIKKTAPLPGAHAFPLITAVSKLVRDIHITNEKDPAPGGHVFFYRSKPFPNSNCGLDTNVLTKFHEHRATEFNKTRVLTRFYYSRIGKNAPPNWKPYIILEAIVLTRKNSPPLFHDDRKINVTSRVGHVFLPIRTIFELNLTKFNEDRMKFWDRPKNDGVFPCFHYIHIEKTAPPSGGHVFSPIWTIFLLVRDINETNVLTKFHDNWAKIVTSRVSTRNTAPPPSINGTNVLTKFHEDQTINVASRVVTRQNVDDGRRTTDKKRSQKLTMSTL
ncbi:hypothetical protein DPMN_011458 [Dreissena polymorpha]|uniref:Uncharacterized protein n=1 Tax=Dreissena polymorpha TaxID=45954 RepID=A0A9D4N421_DREPO|nr:hypothetical protein DPMN_011458 [Dreissena polymorpha]